MLLLTIIKAAGPPALPPVTELGRNGIGPGGRIPLAAGLRGRHVTGLPLRGHVEQGYGSLRGDRPQQGCPDRR